jgi:hypothetical protein
MTPSGTLGVGSGVPIFTKQDDLHLHNKFLQKILITGLKGKFVSARCDISKPFPKTFIAGLEGQFVGDSGDICAIAVIIAELCHMLNESLFYGVPINRILSRQRVDQ